MKDLIEAACSALVLFGMCFMAYVVLVWYGGYQ